MCTMRFGNIWDVYKKEFIFVCANNYIKINGELVMGVGGARELRNRAPEAPMYFGHEIRQSIHEDYKYMLLGYHTEFNPCLTLDSTSIGTATIVDARKLGILQTKRYWKNPATVELITESLLGNAHKKSFVQWHNDWWDKEIFNITYPGIGYGGLTEDEVEPILEQLPDWCHVWRPMNWRPNSKHSTTMIAFSELIQQVELDMN